MAGPPRSSLANRRGGLKIAVLSALVLLGGCGRRNADAPSITAGAYVAAPEDNRPLINEVTARVTLRCASVWGSDVSARTEPFSIASVIKLHTSDGRVFRLVSYPDRKITPQVGDEGTVSFDVDYELDNAAQLMGHDVGELAQVTRVEFDYAPLLSSLDLTPATGKPETLQLWVNGKRVATLSAQPLDPATSAPQQTFDARTAFAGVRMAYLKS